jgi:N-carbamoylputrescine amidase
MMKITVCQMPDDPEKFAMEWERLSRHVKRQSSDLVLLPEMPFYHWFCAGPKYDPKVWEEAVRSHSRWMARLDELGAPLVSGSRPVHRGEKRLNEGFVWSEKEGTRGVHFKKYLPNEPGFYEARWYNRGEKPFTPFEVGDWKAGFMICSDIWSMADARVYGKKGVQLLLVPRATGSLTASSRWVAGGRVAAVLAGAYCASSNRSGKRGEATFGGHSWVIDPDGDVLALTSESRPFATVSIDRTRAEKAKTTYPRDSLEPD